MFIPYRALIVPVLCIRSYLDISGSEMAVPNGEALCIYQKVGIYDWYRQFAVGALWLRFASPKINHN